MKRVLSKVKEYFFQTVVIGVSTWIISAIIFDLFFIYLHFTNPSLSRYYLDVIMNTLYEL